jgi:thymidylate synthase (FAD)
MISSPSSSCKLISLTPNAEEHIVYCARVSNPSNQENSETAPKLLKYLINHKHWSPFQMSYMTVEVNTTRAIAAQILRHRFDFQEFSQRYSDVGLLGPAVMPHLRRQDKKNRQNSIDDISSEVVAGYYRRIGQLFEESEHLYQEMVTSGIAKECARGILPLNSRTRMYMGGNVRQWLHYLQVRTGAETQLEHRQIALEILGIFKEHLPNVYEAAFKE